jgi:release factor glutamine methyltransferase
MSVFYSSGDLSDIAGKLRAAGCVFAEEEARILGSSAGTRAELAEMVAQRIAGLPIEQVVGWGEFCGLRIAVDANVFVPRRRSEFLVRQAVKLARRPRPGAARRTEGTSQSRADAAGRPADRANRPADGAGQSADRAGQSADRANRPADPGNQPEARAGQSADRANRPADRASQAPARPAMAADGDEDASPLIVVDLCCGSGAVGVALAALLGGAELYAVDIDPATVRCARRNMVPGGNVYEGDLYQPLPAELLGRVDVLVANAPYVPTAEIGLMPAEARLHEPRVALDGGADGVEVHRRIAAAAPRWLAPGGYLLIETSDRQAPLTAAAVADAGLAPQVASSEEWSATVVIGSWPEGAAHDARVAAQDDARVAAQDDARVAAQDDARGCARAEH